ncbi:NAC domain-containing protein 67-like isoform X2 [Hibiscus syriacus]|uniref:NAC domain-containing protein 67-like isoform X2 n=1 Tax=Hibiscus syriacus TaxID=106335 RepID=A0A6A2ZEH9_HIBSY|nr:NAC domain-containing protein 67-like isoform X2 [Hibiscus syriacus]
MEDGCLMVNQLPLGFRFCPTDEELVLHFLYPKSSLLPCYPNIIPELDIYLLHPWELDGKALLSEKRYFFFGQTMENRVLLEKGYWKQLDFEQPIFSSGSGKKIGVKKLHGFFMGEAPFGMKTNWLMQEYHLSSHYYKTKENKKVGNAQSFSYSDEDGSEMSYLDEMFLSLDDDDLDDISSSQLIF